MTFGVRGGYLSIIAAKKCGQQAIPTDDVAGMKLPYWIYRSFWDDRSRIARNP
ncbi:MAG TPA: hypothetical protein IGS52_04640 [Oscillatoriaceae cyanobacterium M33_DOE_052]|nr:hypothetical protein [Oscillatoriaceae cyanobacterium M33_DOE_052]